MTLGQRIQELRKRAGLTQEQLAEQLGVTRQAVSKWESDNGVPELDALIALSWYFKLTLGELLGVEERRRDYKTALQELVQRESGQVLGYQLIGAEGPDHAKIFSVEVDLNGTPIGKGKGRSKEEADQNAAKAAIEKLKG